MRACHKDFTQAMGSIYNKDMGNKISCTLSFNGRDISFPMTVMAFLEVFLVVEN